MKVKEVVPIAASVVLEVIKFADEMRRIYGKDITPEQIAEAWERSRERFAKAKAAWEAARE